LLDDVLAEREPHPRLYAGLLKLLEGMLADTRWLETQVRFELLLLQDLGFALDLDRCAVTGAADDLAYVSPRTGRAVSRAGAGELAARLLPLPAFLLADVPATFGEILAGLRLSGHFLARQALAPADKPLPAVRERLIMLVQQRNESTA
jgi:DNA repair protein RecO (recombination protein O)